MGKVRGLVVVLVLRVVVHVAMLDSEVELAPLPPRVDETGLVKLLNL